MTQQPTRTSPLTPRAQIRSMRMIVGAMLAGLVVLLAIAFFIAPGGDDPWRVPTMWQLMLVVLAIGELAIALVLPRAAMAKAGSDTASLLMARLQPMTILRAALTEAIGVLAFTFAFVEPTGNRALLALGAVLSVPAMALIAWPSRRNIASLLSAAQPAARAEVLREWFGVTETGATPPADATGGGITKY